MSSSSNSDSRPRSPIRGLPLHQPYFTFRDDAWKPVEAASSSSPSSSPGAREQESSTTRLPAEVVFAVLSWNIDFQREFAEPRMKAALNHVYHTLQHRLTVPSIIMFEEMEECDLTTIQEQGWVREGYHLTDLTREFWESPGHYGTCMLVPKTLKIKAVFRVHYEITSMQRDALFVDIALPENKTLRVCATHLESLRARVPKRPAQLATAARYLHEADVGIIAGDFNAIEPFDMTLHVENNLKDAYLERGGQEDEEAGMTWGQMAFTFSRKQYGLCRMDKVLFCGRQRVELLDFATFGSDVQVEDEADRKAMMDELGTMLEKPWVTDHLGVRADFRIILSG